MDSIWDLDTQRPFDVQKVIDDVHLFLRIDVTAARSVVCTLTEAAVSHIVRSLKEVSKFVQDVRHDGRVGVIVWLSGQERLASGANGQQDSPIKTTSLFPESIILCRVGHWLMERLVPGA